MSSILRFITDMIISSVARLLMKMDNKLTSKRNQTRKIKMKILKHKGQNNNNTKF